MGEEPEVFEPVVLYVSIDVVHFEVVEDGNGKGGSYPDSSG